MILENAVTEKVTGVTFPSEKLGRFWTRDVKTTTEICVTEDMENSVTEKVTNVTFSNVWIIVKTW